MTVPFHPTLDNKVHFMRSSQFADTDALESSSFKLLLCGLDDLWCLSNSIILFQLSIVWNHYSFFVYIVLLKSRRLKKEYLFFYRVRLSAICLVTQNNNTLPCFSQCLVATTLFQLGGRENPVIYLEWWYFMYFWNLNYIEMQIMASSYI